MEAREVLLTVGSSLILAPLIGIALLILYVYRSIVDVILKLKLKDKYAGLLDGADAVWAIEERSALSVINVLVILEKDARHSNGNFLENFRTLVKSRMLDSPFEKLLYARRKKFGYYYWERTEEIDLEKRVRWLEYERTSCDGSCDNIYNGHLKRVLRHVCNQPLPDDHTATWEILVGKSCPRSSYHYLRRMEERLRNGKIRIPILFRVHHSLADGVDLLTVLLNALVDQNPGMSLNGGKENPETEMNDYETVTVIVPQGNGHKAQQMSMSRSYLEELLSARMPFTYFLSFPHAWKFVQNSFELGSKYLRNLTTEEVQRELLMLLDKKWIELKDFVSGDLYLRVKALLRVFFIVLGAPACLIRQALRSIDNSALHGPELTGEKVISYWLEDDFRNSDEEKLLAKVQNIKYITGARFEDVLLAALSASLHKYYLRVNESAPTSISVVLPSRVDDSSDNYSLRNNFTVGLLRVCVSEINGEVPENPREDSKVLERLQDIKNAKIRLLNSPDRLVNFLVIKYLSAALPEIILRPLLESHSTMVFSNLIGPDAVKILSHPLKNIAFWIPNRSYTGLGCSLLSYRGYLHLSLIADKALVREEKLLTEILENTVREIDFLYDRLTLSFPKRTHYNVSTPMKKDIGVL